MSVKKHKETIKQRFIIYLLTYHIIFVTKFRKKVITNEMGDFMKNICGEMLFSGAGVIFAPQPDPFSGLKLPSHVSIIASNT